MTLLEDARLRSVPFDDVLRIEAPIRRRQSVGILELTREMRAVRKAGIDRNFRHGAIGVLNQPARVAHAKLSVDRCRTQTRVLPAQALELSHGEAKLICHDRNRYRPREI